MGIRAERGHVFNYTSVYENTKFYYGGNSFRLAGKIGKWEEIEILARIFYKKLEKLLYGPDVTEVMYYSSIQQVLKENNLLDATLLEVIKKKDYQIEVLNTMIMKIFDFVYFNVKKHLPYTKQLSLIANAVSELLENTFKYTSKEYSVTAGLLDGEEPLMIKIENRYDDFYAENTLKNIANLKKGIEEIAIFESPEQAYLEVMRARLENSINEGCGEEKASRLGFAKIIADTHAKITFSEGSKQFGANGVTLLLKLPICLVAKEEILNIIDRSLHSSP